MKAVMISIQPIWVEKIANGQKTIDVRKTRPKIDTPFKCYIYCTFPKKPVYTLWLNRGKENRFLADGKVIGHFVCDRIEEVHEYELIPSKIYYELEKERIDLFLKQSCLSYGAISEYRKNLPYFKPLYGWHISDLVIYDEPKVLGEFYSFDESIICGDCCSGCIYHETPVDEMPCRTCAGDRKYLYRPPQSWCYVEEKE